MIEKEIDLRRLFYNSELRDNYNISDYFAKKDSEYSNFLNNKSFKPTSELSKNIVLANFVGYLYVKDIPEDSKDKEPIIFNFDNLYTFCNLDIFDELNKGTCMPDDFNYYINRFDINKDISELSIRRNKFFDIISKESKTCILVKNEVNDILNILKYKEYLLKNPSEIPKGVLIKKISKEDLGSLESNNKYLNYLTVNDEEYKYVYIL